LAGPRSRESRLGCRRLALMWVGRRAEYLMWKTHSGARRAGRGAIGGLLAGAVAVGAVQLVAGNAGGAAAEVLPVLLARPALLALPRRPGNSHHAGPGVAARGAGEAVAGAAARHRHPPRRPPASRRRHDGEGRTVSPCQLVRRRDANRLTRHPLDPRPAPARDRRPASPAVAST
jgi:hypothetical protein